MEVLIIEDEKYQAKMLEKLLEKKAIKVVATLHSIGSSVQFLKKHQPDLIFMDVELSDGVCFDIFTEINVSSPVIFVTNHQGFSLEAFYSNGIHYLVKPITAARLDEGLIKYESLKKSLSGQSLDSSIPHAANELGTKQKLLLKVGKKSIPININEMAYFIVEDGYVYLHTLSYKKYLIDQNIEEINSSLPCTQFFRLNRQCITNINIISSYSPFTRGRIKVEIKPYNVNPMIVSFNKRSEFLNWMQNNI